MFLILRLFSVQSINHTALNMVLNGLREDVNRFSLQNIRLSTSVDELKVQVFCLSETEQRLKDLTKQQDLNVKSLVGLVGESKQITEEMKKVIRLDIIAELIAVVLKGEKDESGDFSDKEIKRLVVYARRLPSVKVNEEKLENAIRRDRSIFALINLVLDIYRGGSQEGDQIFVIDETDPELQAHVSEKE
jgi:hypothetical protein